MKRVLIVDDSLSVREFLRHLIDGDPHLSVAGTAEDGEKALDKVERLKPDIVTMDITMPRLDGFSATRAIMEHCPVPIVIVSANWTPEEVSKTFDALEAGALSIIQKPGLGAPDFEVQREHMLSTLRLMSEVRVVRRYRRSQPRQPVEPPPQLRESAVPGGHKVVAIGASTGGPQVLRTILAGLPETFALPVVVVQHIAKGFLQGLVHWIDQATPMQVLEAKAGDTIQPGRVYFAPDEHHMRIDRTGRILLNTEPPVNGIRPCVSALFRSVVESYGAACIGVLLTGMGRDGAVELNLMRNAGGLTIVQDEPSSIVHGMPGHAIRLGAARHVLSPAQITVKLLQATGTTSS